MIGQSRSDAQQERSLSVANQHGEIEIVENSITRLELQGNFDFSIGL